jgi:hypothetical protein
MVVGPQTRRNAGYDVVVIDESKISGLEFIIDLA